MPEPLEEPTATTENTPEGAVDLEAQADSFDALELYGETQEPETPEVTPETTPKEEVQETTPVEQTPVDPIYELEGYGQIRASQMRVALASQEKYSDIEQEMVKLDAERGRLDSFRSENANAIQMVSLLEIPALRDAVQKGIADVLTGNPELDVKPDGQGQKFFENLPQQLQTQPPPDPEPSAEVQELLAFKAKTEINEYLTEIHTKHPEIVTDDFAKLMVNQTIELYGEEKDSDIMGIREVRLVGNALLNARIAESGLNDREVVEALGKLPAGAVVVTGGGSRAAVTQAELQDPRKMEWGELERELGDDLYTEVEA